MFIYRRRLWDDLHVTAYVEVCAACFAPAAERCSCDEREPPTVLLTVYASGRYAAWTPPSRSEGDGGDPGDPGGWEGDIETVEATPGVDLYDRLPRATLAACEEAVVVAADDYMEQVSRDGWA